MHLIHLLLVGANQVTAPAPTIFDLITNALAYSVIIPIALFVYFYGTRPAPGKWYRRRFSALWRSTEIGRVLMNQMIAWLVYLIFVSFSLVLGDFFGKVAIRFVLYTWLVYLFWRLFITLRRIQRNKIPALANTVGINLDANTDGTARELKK